MQQRLDLIIVILFFRYLSIKSQTFIYTNEQITLDCSYSSGKSSSIVKATITTRPIPKTDIDNYYLLIGDSIGDKAVRIRQIKCTNFLCNCYTCYYESSYISIPSIRLIQPYKLNIDNKNSDFKRILRDLLARSTYYDMNMNFTCILTDYKYEYYEKPKDPYDYPLSKTSLVGIIFLTACIVLVFILCFGWFGLIYYRRFKQHRMKKRLKKALMQSTQLILDKSPVITYDPENKEPNFTDDEPMCAICLEIFKPKEKIRKLACLHYFHTTCIDPWVLSHQNCPLCNRNILDNSIPSISSSVMAAINEERNDQSTTIVNDNNNQRSQAQL